MPEKIMVFAEVRPGKVDYAATAYFLNSDRAVQYAQMLADSGEYENGGGVFVSPTKGEKHRIKPRETQ